MKKKRKQKSPTQKLLDAAVIWHGATVLNPRCQPTANAMLRKQVIRYLRSQVSASPEPK